MKIIWFLIIYWQHGSANEAIPSPLELERYCIGKQQTMEMAIEMACLLFHVSC